MSTGRTAALERTVESVLHPEYRRTGIGVIPDDWDVVSLEAVARIATGSTPPTINRAYYGDDFPFISPADLGDAPYVYEAAKGLSALGFERSRKFPSGSVLFTCIGSTIGKCAIAGRELTSNQQINAVFPTNALVSEYLYYALRQLSPKIRQLSGTQAVPLINKAQFGSTLIPMPTIEEQRAIAEVLSDADALIGALDNLIAKKRAIKLATMQQLLTGRSRLPGFAEPWRECSLGDLGRFSKGRGIKRDDVMDDGLPCIRYGEIYTRYHEHITRPVSMIPPSVAKSALPIHKGDLLFAGSGETAEDIGKCVAYLGEGEAYAGGDIIVLSPTSEDSRYLGYRLNHHSVTEQRARLGQGDAVVHISAANLASIKITLPRVEEQRAIASVLSDMDAEIAALESRRDKTRAIKQAMMQALLTGRIRLVKPEKSA